MRELSMRGTTAPISWTISSHMSCFVTVKALPGISPGSVPPSSSCSIVGFLVVGFVGVGWRRYPLVGSQLVQTNTVGLLAESMCSSATWYPKR